MAALYWTAVTGHVLAALVWLGGTFFLALIGAPVLRRVEPPALRQALFQQLGRRFRAVGWALLATLVATGTLLLHERGLLRWAGVLGAPRFWRKTVGLALAAKLAAVAVMLVLSLVHDLVLGPAAGRAPAGSARAVRLRRGTAWLGRASALVGVALVAAAVRLARG